MRFNIGLTMYNDRYVANIVSGYYDSCERELELYLTNDIQSSLRMLYQLLCDNLNDEDEISVNTCLYGDFEMNAFTITNRGWHSNWGEIIWKNLNSLRLTMKYWVL